ncbi:hypothetical protein V1499_23130 (plasmid) [Neobacillus sp. SCS-31]|uniref:hypothetical protein n=1 Tax=Neobacillus oceani TaxID=3115292 RepID=UPI003905801B
MLFTERQQKMLKVICSQPGGVSTEEAMEATGFSYMDIKEVLHELTQLEIEVRALRAWDNPDPISRRRISRLYLSPYDRNYTALLKRVYGDSMIANPDISDSIKRI